MRIAVLGVGLVGGSIGLAAKEHVEGAEVVGFGRHPKIFMKPGDVVEVEVSQIGVLRNPIEA